MVTRLLINRKRLGLSQAEAGRKVGISRQLYGGAERGKIVLTAQQRAALAALFGESEGKLFYESGLARLG